MAKTPDEIVAEIDRRQNEEDKDLPRRAAKAALNLVKPKATKPDTGETTNPMGDKYSKGGKVMEHKHKMEHDKKHAAGHMHEQDKVKGHSAGHKMHHEHVKAMCGGGMARAKK